MKTKRILAALCIGTILMSITACGNNESSEASTTSITVTESTTTVTEATVKSEPTSAINMDETTSDVMQTATSETAADPIEEINNAVAEDLMNTFSALSSEYEQLKLELDTYEKYLDNADKMEAFYDNIYKTSQELNLRLCEYSLYYAETIVNSDMSFDDKYDMLDELYDNIYDDAGDDIYDEIYDGLLQDIYDDYYDGLLKDAYDNADYKEWADARSDEYDWWSDTRSDVYKNWADFRSDIYEFWSDMRSEMWSNDTERALEKIEDFREDIAKMKE